MKMSINTSLISLTASQLESYNTQLLCAVSDVSSACSALRSSWSGQAGEKAAELFNEIKNGCIDAQNKAVADYAAFLRERASEGYAQVEKGNTDLAAQFK